MHIKPRRRQAALAASALALGTVGATSALATTASTGSPLQIPAVATATKAFPATAIHATTLGLANSAQSLHLVIGLAPRNVAAEQAALKAMYTPGSATYHQFLTPAETTAEFSPTQASVDAVTSYLASNGFSNISVDSNRLVVTADATVAQAEKAFGTSIADLKAGNVNFYANTAPALVPTALAGIVQSVTGLDNFPLPTPHPIQSTRSAAGSPSTGGLNPQQFQTTYDAAGTSTGAKTNIAIFTEGNITQVYKDLTLAETKNNLPHVKVTQVNVGPQSNDTSGMDEFDLDTQSSTAMAQTVNNLYLYNVGSLIDSNIVAAVNKFVAQDKAVALSASVGECDVFPYADGSMVSTDSILMTAAMQGQTMFASSGDNGEACGVLASVGAPDGPPGTNWPASGTYVTAVGGTSLISDSQGNRIEEIGWLGSGGGYSETEPAGFWQADTDADYVTGAAVTGGREVPDVALDADPNVATPALIYVNGTQEGVGGTSLASPLMLGAWARLESGHANKLGFAPIDLYNLYDAVNPGTPIPGSPVGGVIPTPDPAAVPGFTDIVAGTNGLYVAAPGDDPVTGLGAPDIAALNKAL